MMLTDADKCMMEGRRGAAKNINGNPVTHDIEHWQKIIQPALKSDSIKVI